MYWTRYRTFVVASVLALSAYGLVRGEMPQVETGTWHAIGGLGSVRAGAASALLDNSTLLVTGGAGPDGALATAEILESSGTFSPAPSMNVARFDHAAVALDEGRVLVTGGRNGEGAVGSAEIYSGGEWSLADGLADARWGHTATLLADGRVLIAGGENAAGVLASVELFDPNTDSFYVAGTLSSPRKGHAVARLADGRVLIAGGFNGDATLSSIDVFDPETDSISPLGLSLGTARAGLSATTLLDGKVLFFGGNDGSNDLATSEVFNPAAATITAGPSAPVARRDHDAFLLPNNNAVLIVGGATADGASAPAELYIPWLNQFWSTSAPAAPRYRATGSALSKESYGDAPAGAGLLAVAGGEGQSSSEAYGFATISVDKDDYSPGQTVYVSGRGWQPGDVTFEVREVPAIEPPVSFTLTADNRGAIPSQALFAVDGFDLGVRFFLTAHDAASQAQITFTDGNAVSVSGTVVSSTTGNPISGATIACTSGCNNAPTATTTSNATGAYVFANSTTRLSFDTSGPVDLDLTASKAGFVAQTITLRNVKNGDTITAANFTLVPSIAASSVTVFSATGTYSGNTSLSATLTSAGSGVSGKSLAFTLNGTSVGTATTNASGTATLNNVSLSGINAGTYTGAIGASFVGDSGFAASSGTGNLTVNALSVNLTGTRTYDGTTTAAASILTISNRVGSDAVTIAAGNATLASKDAGSQTITTFSGLTLGGASAANYTLTGASGAVTITPRVVQLTGTRPYDGTSDVAASALSVSNAAAGDAVNVASGTATVASKDVGSRTITALGTLILGNNASGNYTLSGASGTVAITARAIALTGTRVYDGTADAPAGILAISNLVAGDSVNVASGTATLASKNAGPQAITNLGTLALGNNASGNYTLTGASGTVMITSRAVTLTGSRVYDGTSDAAASILSVSNAVAGDTVNVASGTATLGAKDVGAQPIASVGTLVLGNNAAGNYTLTGATGTVAITKRSITLTADAQSKTYGDEDPALTYKVTSGSLVTGDDLTGGLAREAGESVAGGPYAINQGTLSAGGNYNLTFVGAQLAITARPITVTADAQSKTYGDDDPALTYRVTAGSLVGSDTFTGALSRAAGANAGTYEIAQGTLVLSANYALTFVGANFTITERPITVTADAQSKTYGDEDPALTYKVTTGSLVGSDSFTGALSRAAGANVGTYAIEKGTLDLSANYVLTFVGANLTITARQITVTADAQSKMYGEADPALTYTVTNGSLVSGDAFSGGLTRVPGGNVGIYAIEQGTLALTANYALTFVGANLTITARPITVTADAQSKVYGDADPTLTYKVTSGSLVPEETFTGAITRAAGANVGTYAIGQGTLALSTNYDLAFVGANLTITARAITVTADPQHKMYGDPDPALTYAVTSGSLVTGDAFIGALSRAAGTNVGTYAIEQGTLVLSANYALSYIGSNLTIALRPITVTADAKTKIYGYGDPALSYQLTTGSLVSGDSFTGALTRAPGENVGTYAVQKGTLALSSNYSLTYVPSDFTITPRAITVTADGKTKVYGTLDPPLTYQVTSGTLVGADAFAGGLTRAVGQNVGAYAIQQGSLALSTNYALTFVGAELTITRATLTVSADDKQKVYDGSPFTAFTSAITGFVNGDSPAVVTGTVTYGSPATTAVNPGTYTISPVVTGLSALNYTFTSADGTLTITYGTCSPTLGAGGVVLPPINADGSSVYQRKGGSTIPVKFRVCGASGQSISNPAAVFAGTGGSLTMLSAVRGTVTIANEAAIIDIPDVAFRWDPSGQQWILNLATSNLESGSTYSFSINLAYGHIQFRVGVK